MARRSFGTQSRHLGGVDPHAQPPMILITRPAGRAEYNPVTRGRTADAQVAQVAAVSLLRQLVVPAEGLAHGREHLVGVVR
ncbi:hypothetical protein, partial [Nocardia farcinica]|uniref:hypothetical protein n=1 Tax=Nocardia farcinica TaxID=37329 RepID=UPI0034DAD6D5